MTRSEVKNIAELYVANENANVLLAFEYMKHFVSYEKQWLPFFEEVFALVMEMEKHKEEDFTMRSFSQKYGGFGATGNSFSNRHDIAMTTYDVVLDLIKERQSFIRFQWSLQKNKDINGNEYIELTCKLDWSITYYSVVLPKPELDDFQKSLVESEMILHFNHYNMQRDVWDIIIPKVAMLFMYQFKYLNN